MVKKVLILKGGLSAEREVSLVSADGVEQALRKLGYEVMAHDWKTPDALLKVIKEFKPDVVFNALHGNWGEDGEIQGFLDVLQIPYTHSGLRASLLGMDKSLTKIIAEQNGVPVAKGEKMTFAQFKAKGTKLDFPYVMKPAADGSSVGVFIIHNQANLAQVNYDDEREILIEKYIAGQELTVAVLDGKALAVTELCASNEFYDYQAKYTAGMTVHKLPADIPSEVAKQAMHYAEVIHHALGCRAVSRSDFRYNPQDGVVFLEVNTNPGLTPLSLVPEQARFCGIGYEGVCEKLLASASFRCIMGD